MKLNKISIFLILIYLYSCAGYENNKALKVDNKIYHTSSGFALVYEDSLYEDKIVNKKINSNDILVLHTTLKTNTPIRITNLSNSKYIDTKIYKRANYPKIFNVVISKKAAALLELDSENPLVEIIELKKNRTINDNDSMRGSYLGPEYSQQEIEKKLKKIGANFKILEEDKLIEKTSSALIEGKAIGWFQGRMEFGPRALGARSIIADSRSETMQKKLNLKVKYRESFRPFAPSVIREDLSEWFDLNCDSPYMLLVAKVSDSKCRKMTKDEELLFGIDKLNIKRSEIPAVTHVDYSARVQTVHKETNPKYYKLLSEFKKKTGCPVLVNTSFNVRGEPIVGSPEDAYNCFMGTEMDVLVIGNCYLNKESQNKS